MVRWDRNEHCEEKCEQAKYLKILEGAHPYPRLTVDQEAQALMRKTRQTSSKIKQVGRNALRRMECLNSANWIESSAIQE
jgi:hypothetical protein